MNRADVEKISGKWQGRQVAVVGDLMLDRYVWGHASRISQEAPIPVLEVRETTVRPGGAANVLANIASLGARALAFGAVGEDTAGAALRSAMEAVGIETTGVVSDPALVTTEKQRIIAGSQQVVRVDTEFKRPLDSGLADRMLDRLKREVAAGAVHGIILEDYAKGVLTPLVMEAVSALARAAGIPLALDPHPANPQRVAGLTLMTPNRSEAFALAGQYLTPQMAQIENDLHLEMYFGRKRGA